MSTDDSLGESETETLRTINAARTPADLQGLGLSARQAASVLEYKAQHGDFAQLDDLLACFGVGPRTVERLKLDLPPSSSDWSRSEELPILEVKHTAGKRVLRREDRIAIAVLVFFVLGMLGMLREQLFPPTNRQATQSPQSSSNASTAPSTPSGASAPSSEDEQAWVARVNAELERQRQVVASKSSVSSGQRRISEDYRFGCTDRDYYEKMVEYSVRGDKAAFSSAFSWGLTAGTCTIFEAGEPVYVMDTAIWSGLVRVRRPGETTEYWTSIESVK
jgi:hypothetical protein